MSCLLSVKKLRELGPDVQPDSIHVLDVEGPAPN